MSISCFSRFEAFVMLSQGMTKHYDCACGAINSAIACGASNSAVAKESSTSVHHATTLRVAGLRTGRSLHACCSCMQT